MPSCCRAYDHDVLRAVEQAREVAADLDHVLADGLAEQQRVERDRRLDGRQALADVVRDRRDGVGRNVAFVLLEKVGKRDQPGALVLVLADDPLGSRGPAGPRARRTGSRAAGRAGTSRTGRPRRRPRWGRGGRRTRRRSGYSPVVRLMEQRKGMGPRHGPAPLRNVKRPCLRRIQGLGGRRLSIETARRASSRKAYALMSISLKSTRQIDDREPADDLRTVGRMGRPRPDVESRTEFVSR